jgi:hypothetical protein
MLDNTAQNINFTNHLVQQLGSILFTSRLGANLRSTNRYKYPIIPIYQI